MRISASQQDKQTSDPADRQSMTGARRQWTGWAAAAALVLVAMNAVGQDEQGPTTPPPPPAAEIPAETVALEVVQQRISELDLTGARDDETKAQLELLRQTQVLLQQAEQFAAKTIEYQQLARGAPEQVREIQAKLAEALAEFKPEVPADATMDLLRQKLSDAQAVIRAAAGMKENVDSEEASRKARREQIPGETAAVTQTLEDLKQRRKAPPVAEESAGLQQARRWRLLAEERRAQQQLAMLQEELRSYDARRDLLPARRQLREREVLEAERRMRAWQEIVTAREQEEARRIAQEAREARTEAAREHAVVQEVAEENEDLTGERSGLSARLEEQLKEVASSQELYRQLRDEFQGTRERVAQAGLTHAIGFILQSRRAGLPDLSVYRKRIRDRQREISRLQLAWIKHNDALLDLVDLDAAVQQRAEEIDEDLPPEDRQDIEAALREQLKRQKEEYLPSLLGAIDLYLKDALIELDQAERNLVELIAQYDEYLAERVLWIKSCAAIGWRDARDAAEAMGWLLAPDSWRAMGAALWSDTKTNWPTPAGPALALALLWGLRRRIRRRLRDVAAKVKKARTDRYVLTLRAALWTVMLAVMWPGLTWFIAWRVGSAAALLSGDELAFARAAADALKGVAWFFLLAEVLLVVCRPQGLAEAHFRWPEASRRTIRQHLPWMMVVGLPTTFLVLMVEFQPNESFKGSLGRVVFVLTSLAFSMFLCRLFRLGGGLSGEYISRHRGGWVDRLRYVWFPVLVAAPLVLAIESALGYHYTALQLAGRLTNTAALVVGMLVIWSLLTRWVFVNQRRIAIEQVLKRRAAAEKERAAQATEAGDGETPPRPEARSAEEDLEIDVVAISSQTRSLIRSGITITLLIGILLVWADVLPALGVLRNVVVWSDAAPAAATVEPPETTPRGEGAGAIGTAVVTSETTLSGEEAGATRRGVTLADLALALLIVVMTVIISRNIPGLLEIVILQRLPFTPSGRYGITTLVQYVLVVIGIILAFNAIGIGWSKVQWLVAAITVGLGFGLQEIFANFVSGLILLFERPIRVGDTVTVGTTSGTVSRIRIRATTITDWDRKELVIPNREFVTGQVVNWSLSDSILRTTIPVGIAYGSDTELAEKLLLQEAEAHSHVLADPPPRALFIGFGDSSLNFELRVYIPSIDYLLAVKSDLHFAIDQAFRKAGVEISFPQRDLHIRSVDAALPVVQGRGRDAKRE